MKVELIKPYEGKAYDITNACRSITWSGSILGASRTAEIEYINAPYDTLITIPTIVTGDFLSLQQDGAEIFWGQFWSQQASSITGTITAEAQDFMKSLLNSYGKYNFKNIAPEQITTQVCADMQIPVGTIASTGLNIKSMLCNNKSFYDIIMGAYSQAYKISGKKYLIQVSERKLQVIEQNQIIAGLFLSDDLNITESSVQESSDKIINQVKIYDSNGKQIGEVKDEESISKFGAMQGIYEEESGIDPLTAAKSMINTEAEQTIQVSAIGDIACISGRGICVKDSATGLTGLYWIKSDKHIWSGDAYTMELELTFEKLMDVRETETEEK